ncbi:MAG: sugar ABC transporter permease [Spirochaetia bacterium]|nr:sugar ABC transporter permease [Spirochaetia bacterium]
MLISRSISHDRADKIYSWLFLLPVFVILLIAAFIPLGYGFGLSFFKYKLNLQQSPLFVGLENYIDLFRDELFMQSLKNNIAFALMSVAIEIVIGIIIAMLLSDDNSFSRIATTFLLIPMIIAPVASGTLWKMMLDRTYGIVNYLLSFVGLPAVSWLADFRIAIYTIVFVDAWQFIPFVAILVLSSIKSIPKSFLDAARVDGASPLKVFTRIVLPITAPVIIIVAMVRFIDAFKVFDTIFVMTQGGPGNATEMLPTYIYRQGIKFLKVGYSSATAILFITVMSLIAWQFIRLRSKQLRRVG